MGAPARAGEFATEDPTGPLTSTGSVGTADYPGLMLRRTDLRPRPLPPTAALRALLPRAEVDVEAVVERVRPIVEAVRERGAEAALDYSERFDRVRPATVRVPPRR